MKAFYILLNDFNTKNPESYDIMPYLIQTYKSCKEKGHWWPMYSKDFKSEPKAPYTFDEFKQFVDKVCKYQYWARAEYEWIMCPWPYHNLDSEDNIARFKKDMRKIDGYEQIKMNLDVITDIFIQNVKE